MAYDKVVDSGALDTQLTSIADAIRAKTGSTDALTFPVNFKEKLDALKVGYDASTDGRKIFFGSFTLAETSSYIEVTHTLGEPPVGCLLWTNDDAFSQTDTQEIFIAVEMMRYDINGYGKGDSNKGVYGYSTVGYKNSASSSNGMSGYPTYMTPSGSSNGIWSPFCTSASGTVANTVIYKSTNTSVKIGNGYTNPKFHAGHTYHYILFGDIL